MLVFGHTIQRETLNIDNRIFGIDRGMVLGGGGIWMRGDEGVDIKSMGGGNRHISPEVPRQKLPPYDNYLKEFLSMDSDDMDSDGKLTAHVPKSVRYRGPITVHLCPDSRKSISLQIVHQEDIESAEIKALLSNYSCPADYYIIIKGADSGPAVIALHDKAEIELGRINQFNIRFPDTVSKTHVRIQRRGDDIIITDLKSTNGTRIE